MTSIIRPLSLLLLLAPGQAPGDSRACLPAEECVRLMRGARIARMHDDAAAERAKLKAALDACPGEIAPIHALVNHYRRQPERLEGYREFFALLSNRLRDPAYDLPAGVAEYLMREPAVEREELSEVLANVSRQTAVESPAPRLLRIQAQLQARLGQLEAAAETLERLRRLDDSADLIETLFSLYARLERWQDAADLLEPRIEGDARLRFSYLQALGKLGRTEELLKQIEFFSVRPPATEDGAEVGPLVRADSGKEVMLANTRELFDPLLKRVAWDLRDRGQDADAERIFRDLLARSPGDPSLQTIVHHLYAGAEERQSQTQALADRWAAETDPRVLFDGGTQKLTAGDAAGAIDLLRRAAPAFPDLEAAWYNLGTAAYQLKEWPTVDSAFARAAELNPARAARFFFRGIALYELARCGEAVPALERAVELDPARTLAYYYLAVCHRQLGNPEAAAAARQRYEAGRR